MDFNGLACPPLDFGFGDDHGFGEFQDFFAETDEGVSLEGFFDNVEVDDVGDTKIGPDREAIEKQCPNVRVCDGILKIPNPNLGTKQCGEKPETVTGKGKQIQEKQIKIPTEARDPDRSFAETNEGVSLDGFFDNVEVDDVGDAKIGAEVEAIEKQCPNVRVCDGILKIPNPNLGTKQRGEKPETVPGKGKQIKIPTEARDPDRSTSKVQSTNKHSVPKVECTKRIASSTKVVIDSGTMDYESRLELSKRKLRESYGAADRAKSQRRIAVLDYPPGLPISTDKAQRKRKPRF